MKLIPKLQTAWLPINPRQKFDTPWTKWAREQREAEEKAYQEDMNTPYYKVHHKPSKKEWKELQAARLAEMLTRIRLGEDVSEPVRAINNYIREFKYDVANNNVPKGKYVWPAFVLGASGIGSFLSAPVTTAAVAAASEFGGQTVDLGTKLATGKTWALKMKDWSGLDEEAGIVTNPGAWVGGFAPLATKASRNLLSSADLVFKNFKPNYSTLGINAFNNFPPNTPVVTTRSLNNLRLEVARRLGRYPTAEEVEQFIGANPNIFIGRTAHDVPVVVGPRENMQAAINNLNNMLHGKYVPETPITLDVSRTPLTSPVFRQVQGLSTEVSPRVIQGPTYGAQTARTPLRTKIGKFNEETGQFEFEGGRYTKADLFDANGKLRGDIDFDELMTGAHGLFLNNRNDPSEIFAKLITLYKDPNFALRTLLNITSTNPAGRSGLLVHSHDFDLSADSHRLAQSFLRKSGKELIPIEDFSGTAKANNLGYKNLYEQMQNWKLDEKLSEALNNKIDELNKVPYLSAHLKASQLKNFINNNYTVVKTSPNSGEGPMGTLLIQDKATGKPMGVVKALPEDEVLENAFNKPIQLVNKHFNIELPKPFISNPIAGDEDFIQATFGKVINYPKFGKGAYSLKKGGNIKRKLIKRKY